MVRKYYTLRLCHDGVSRAVVKSDRKLSALMELRLGILRLGIMNKASPTLLHSDGPAIC